MPNVNAHVGAPDATSTSPEVLNLWREQESSPGSGPLRSSFPAENCQWYYERAL
jgi:hypothetical protein